MPNEAGGAVDGRRAGNGGGDHLAVVAVMKHQRILKYSRANLRYEIRRMPLHDRLAWQRDIAKLARAFFPVRPIWGIGRKGTKFVVPEVGA